MCRSITRQNGPSTSLTDFPCHGQASHHGFHLQSPPRLPSPNTFIKEITIRLHLSCPVPYKQCFSWWCIGKFQLSIYAIISAYDSHRTLILNFFVSNVFGARSHYWSAVVKSTILIPWYHSAGLEMSLCRVLDAPSQGSMFLMTSGTQLMKNSGKSNQSRQFLHVSDAHYCQDI